MFEVETSGIMEMSSPVPLPITGTRYILDYVVDGRGQVFSLDQRLILGLEDHHQPRASFGTVRGGYNTIPLTALAYQIARLVHRRKVPSCLSMRVSIGCAIVFVRRVQLVVASIS